MGRTQELDDVRLQVCEVARAIRAVDAGSRHARIDNEYIVAAQSVVNQTVSGEGTDDIELLTVIATVDNLNCHFYPMCALVRLSVLTLNNVAHKDMPSNLALA